MPFGEVIHNIFHYPLIHFGEMEVTLLTIIDFFLVLVIAAGAAYLTKLFFKKRIFKKTKAEIGFQYMISRFVGYCVFLLGFFIGLETLGIDLTSFTVLAGAVGVGVGFGLQHVVNNFVSGVILLSERQIQVGDRIEINGVNGFIQSIGARSSTLLTTNSLLIIIPNSELVSKMVTRLWGRDERYPCRLDVQIPVAYGTDLTMVRDLLLEVVGQNPHVLKHPNPFAGIVEFSDSGVLFKVFFSTFDMINQEMGIRTELYMAIQKAFDEKGIVIPYPRHEIEIKNPVQVLQDRAVSN